MARPKGLDNRDITLHIRLTGAEAFRLAKMAKFQRKTMSEIIRDAVFGDDDAWPGDRKFTW